MKHQVFNQEGILIEEVDVSPTFVNVTGFMMPIFNSPEYMNLALNSNLLIASRLESLMLRLENLPMITKLDIEVLKMTWDAMNLQLLTSENIESWNEIASQCNMPFRFGADGSLLINLTVE
ncbi:MAG TPA: hypothetical protein IGS40_07775 [Trichormus sp. M33_DOE_039]|nr:hypothetical protein [Trichormus sp. M33_DOE_039]